MVPWNISFMLFHIVNVMLFCAPSTVLQLCVFVELLPLSRLPPGSLVVGVSVLPSNLVTTKPRLCIKALTSDSKAKS